MFIHCCAAVPLLPQSYNLFAARVHTDINQDAATHYLRLPRCEYLCHLALQLSLAKKYGNRSHRESESFLRRAGTTARPDPSALPPHIVRDQAATRIQSLVRAEQAWKRLVVHADTILYHCTVR